MINGTCTLANIETLIDTGLAILFAIIGLVSCQLLYDVLGE